MEIQIDGQNDANLEQADFRGGRLLRKQKVDRKVCPKDERNASIKKVSLILLKLENDRTVDELRMLKEHSDAVEEVKSRWKKRDTAKRRLEEFEDSIEELNIKCRILAQAIAQSQHLVVYTGAGISTAAKIPDYRGSNGIWTRLQQGKDVGNYDLSQAEPTYTHMALSELYRKKILKYVVSQNCDGLHLRSGLPKTALSELHGNMYIEVCKNCKPVHEYLRLFDVTENTARYAHKTMRKCYACNSPLQDTIVHFGERGSLQWPVNWSGACKNADVATTILCLGSSLKVLKKYPWLWQMDKAVKKRPNLYIVNLQWTPKDDCANVKIHGKCDVVMRKVMELLGIKVRGYDKEKDPIFYHFTGLLECEEHTLTQNVLKCEKLKYEVKSEPAEEQVLNDDLQNIPSFSSANCDYRSNTNEARTSNDLCANSRLPALSKTEHNSILPPRTAFSIDNILDQTPRTYTNSAMNDALIRYYQLSNILLQNRMLEYPDFLYYPLYTNFLYSGLHSIINPSYYGTNLAESMKLKTESFIEKVPQCEFCHMNYESFSCLFYAKSQAKFLNSNYRVSKVDNSQKLNVCVCCDYSTDEDDVENSDESLADKIPKLDDSSGTCNTRGDHKKIQAGWFGKGYKKNRRCKKR